MSQARCLSTVLLEVVLLLQGAVSARASERAMGAMVASDADGASSRLTGEDVRLVARAVVRLLGR